LSGPSAATIFVTYAGTPATRFDRAYYLAHHVPKVMQAWEQYGLLRVGLFLPAVERDGTIAVIELLFRDAAAVGAALGSPETPGVMADVPNFTDAAPRLLRAAAM
jgi:uncharacterized protein (TIGR02118 family)